MSSYLHSTYTDTYNFARGPNLSGGQPLSFCEALYKQWQVEL